MVYFIVKVALVVRMSKGKKKKSSQGVDQKISQKEGREKKESRISQG